MPPIRFSDQFRWSGVNVMIMCENIVCNIKIFHPLASPSTPCQYKMWLNSPLLPLSTTAYQPTHKSLAFNRKVMSCRLVKLRVHKLFTHKCVSWELNKSEDNIKRLTPNSEGANVTDIHPFWQGHCKVHISVTSQVKLALITAKQI